MSVPNRPLSSNLRHTSFGGSQSQQGQSPMLIARINEKKVELENLKQLRDLSGGLAAQMQTLEDKLSTLSDGTEAVAAVLSNWQSVMQAINMASVKLSDAGQGGEASKANAAGSEVPLPHTLVRIPVDHNDEQTAAANGKP